MIFLNLLLEPLTQYSNNGNDCLPHNMILEKICDQKNIQQIVATFIAVA